MVRDGDKGNLGGHVPEHAVTAPSQREGTRVALPGTAVSELPSLYAPSPFAISHPLILSPHWRF